MELVEKLKSLPIGTKVTCEVENFLGQIVQMKGTIAGPIFQHGYLIASGGWGLYCDDNCEACKEKCKPCFEIPIRPYGKQLQRIFKINYSLKNVTEGWKD